MTETQQETLDGESTFSSEVVEGEREKEGEYTVTETEDGVVLGEWQRWNGDYQTIKTGELILEELLAKNEFGHHAVLTRSLQEWAPTRPSESDDITKTQAEAIFDITANEVNFQKLFDSDNVYESEAELEEAKAAAIEKAEALELYCEQTGRDAVLASAKQAAEALSESKREEKRAKIEERREAERFLKFPDDQIAGWEREPEPHPAYLAYRGYLNARPMVAALYETDEFVKVRAFPLAIWRTITDELDEGSGIHNSNTEIGNELDEYHSEPTGKTPETVLKGAQGLKDWLTTFNIKSKPDTPDIINGWVVTRRTPGESITYTDPKQEAQITANTSEIKLEDSDGKVQTEEVSSFNDGLQRVKDYLYTHPAIEKGGSQVVIPNPDGD